MQRTPEERFWPKVQKTDTCWLWTAAKDRRGYGSFFMQRNGKTRDNNRMVKSHRFAYEALIGPIPDGLVLDHLCRTPACVNPAHLEPVTNVENIMRGIGPTVQNSKRTHCKEGHELSVRISNTRPNGVVRHCRTCERNRDRDRRPRRLAKRQALALGRTSDAAHAPGRDRAA